MVDHDQQFKELLREFWRELLALFVPDVSARLGDDEPDWQPQEVFTNPPLGLVKRVDLLTLLTLRDGERQRGRVLHVEIESDNSLTQARKKLGYYYPALRTRYNLPVTTLAVYLHVGLQGQGFDCYEEREEQEFAPPEAEQPEEAEGAEPARESLYRTSWRYVGLPALSAERYLESGNWLGVALASLMKIEAARKPWLRAEILRRLATECRENDYRKFLLVNCVDAYLQLEGEQLAIYDQLVSQDERYKEARDVIVTTYDRGVADGERKGEVKGERKALCAMVLRLASRRCGVPDEATRKKLEAIEDVRRLENLVEAAAAAQSWEQLLATE